MVNFLENWLSESPDLNRIENLWAILKRGVEEFGPWTKGELMKVILTAWQSNRCIPCEPFSGFDTA
jgi:transposase